MYKSVAEKLARYLLNQVNYYLNVYLGLRVLVKKTSFSYDYRLANLSQKTIMNQARTRFQYDENAKAKVILLIPKMGRESAFFAGLRMITALAVELLQRGLHVHICVTDDGSTGSSVEDVRAQISRYFPEVALERLSITYNDQVCSYSSKDIVVMTAWWTWYCAENILDKMKASYYFIQDFEPGFYPWSSDYALALNTYKNKFIPIFSGHHLKEFFIKQGYEFAFQGLKYDLYLDPNVFFTPTLAQLMQPQRTRKIVIYGRQSATRNMFEMAVHALAMYAEECGSQLEGWQLVSVGEYHPPIKLSHSCVIESIGKLSLDEYAHFLRESDIGVSLMMSPHPSYPPLEMLKSGMKVITNSYENKDLSREYKNIISVEPTVLNLVAALKIAVQQSQRFEERLKWAEENTFCLDRSESFRAAVDSIEQMMGS